MVWYTLSGERPNDAVVVDCCTCTNVVDSCACNIVVDSCTCTIVAYSSSSTFSKVVLPLK